MNKKGLNFSGIYIGVIAFIFIIIGFYIIPKEPSGFWEKYNYTAPVENKLTGLDITSNLTEFSSDIACDTMKISSNGTICKEKKSALKTVTDFVQGMVGNGYQGLVTIYNTLGITKTMISGAGDILEIPTPFMTLITALFIILFVIGVIYLIFNRSDV
jgi:hypothetical protein